MGHPDPGHSAHAVHDLMPVHILKILIQKEQIKLVLSDSRLLDQFNRSISAGSAGRSNTRALHQIPDPRGLLQVIVDDQYVLDPVLFPEV